MLKSKVIDIFKSFDAEEVKKFRSFLISPYFNTNKKVTKLYDIIIKHYPDFDNPNLNKEKIYKKIYPGVKYKDEIMRNLISRLLKSGEDFLRQTGFAGDIYNRDIYLIEEMNRRKIDSLFEKSVRGIESLLEKQEIDGNSFITKFKLETEKYNFNITSKKLSSASSVESDISILIKRGEYLIHFFLLTFLKETDSLSKFSKLFNYDMKDSLPYGFNEKVKIVELLKFLKSRKGKYAKVYEIYYYLFMAFTNFEEENYYRKFKKSLTENAYLFSKDEKHYLFGKLIDYGIIKHREKGTSFDKELFDNYIIYLENEYYKNYRNNYLAPDLFMNILILSLRKKEYVWAENFINTNTDKLRKENRENMYHYSMGRLLFEKGEYDKALDEVNMVTFDQFVFKYHVRNLTLLICYDLGKYDVVKSIIDSYKRFLLKNKMVGEDRKEFYSNFLGFLGQLIKYKTDAEKTSSADKAILERGISRCKNVSFREWIVAKVKEL